MTISFEKIKRERKDMAGSTYKKEGGGIFPCHILGSYI